MTAAASVIGWRRISACLKALPEAIAGTAQTLSIPSSPQLPYHVTDLVAQSAQIAEIETGKVARLKKTRAGAYRQVLMPIKGRLTVRNMAE
jgi:hypothetical protein